VSLILCGILLNHKGDEEMMMGGSRLHRNWLFREEEALKGGE